jgi:hypothetical protein
MKLETGREKFSWSNQVSRKQLVASRIGAVIKLSVISPEKLRVRVACCVTGLCAKYSRNVRYPGSWIMCQTL